MGYLGVHVWRQSQLSEVSSVANVACGCVILVFNLNTLRPKDLLNRQAESLQYVKYRLITP